MVKNPTNIKQDDIRIAAILYDAKEKGVKEVKVNRDGTVYYKMSKLNIKK